MFYYYYYYYYYYYHCYYCFITDKSPQMNEFMSHIKSNSDMQAMFESIQKDATTTTSETSLMDIS